MRNSCKKTLKYKILFTGIKKDLHFAIQTDRHGNFQMPEIGRAFQENSKYF